MSAVRQEKPRQKDRQTDRRVESCSGGHEGVGLAERGADAVDFELLRLADALGGIAGILLHDREGPLETDPVEVGYLVPGLDDLRAGAHLLGCQELAKGFVVIGAALAAQDIGKNECVGHDVSPAWR